jgi:hypothetical protein
MIEPSYADLTPPGHHDTFESASILEINAWRFMATCSTKKTAKRLLVVHHIGRNEMNASRNSNAGLFILMDN